MEDVFRGRAKGPVYADRHLVVMRTTQPSGLRFAGEIDISNSDAVGQSVRIALGDAPRSHLDLSGLSFIDVSGIRALVDAAHDFGDGRELLLHGLARQLKTIMRAIGWAATPTLTRCECGVESR
jgi:anti-anti-sigma factor